MDNNSLMIPESRSFVKAKNEIQEFSKKKPEDINLPVVETEGKYFGWFGTNHNVEGHELNKVTSKMQHYLIQINSLQTDFIDEFGKVYEAFEALDKDYIAAFKSNIMAIRENTNDISIAQQDIRKTVERLEKTILKLKSVSEELNAKIEGLNKSLFELDEDLDTLENKVSEFSNDYKSQIYNINLAQSSLQNNIQALENRLSQYSRLEEFDEMLKFCVSNNKLLSEENERLNKQVVDLQNAFLQEQNSHSERLQRIGDELLVKIKNAYLVGGAGVVLSVMLAGFLFTR